MVDELKTDRKAARAAGDMFYKGSPCHVGHVGKRYTNSNHCLDCREDLYASKNPNSRAYRIDRQTRAEAKAAGETIYYGKPCQAGHDGKRYSANGLCVGCALARNKSNYDPRRNRQRHLKSLYGIGVSDYSRMLADQDGRCSICGLVAESHMHVDHCHETGTVRSLLCNNCNTAIGLFKENPALLQSAIEYLQKHGRKDHSRKAEAA